MSESVRSPAPEMCRATEADADELVELFKSETGRVLDRVRVAELIREYPSAIQRINSRIVGFAFTGRFAPDILELMNIYVAKDLRNQGLGNALLTHLEQEAKMAYKVIILVNSLLYETQDKPLATSFYVENGYQQVLQTKNTRVFAKEIG